MQLAYTSPNLTSDELAVPTARDFVSDVALRVLDISGDLVRILATPATRLERQDTLIPSAMVRNLRICVSIHSPQPRTQDDAQSYLHNGQS